MMIEASINPSERVGARWLWWHAPLYLFFFCAPFSSIWWDDYLCWTVRRWHVITDHNSLSLPSERIMPL